MPLSFSIADRLHEIVERAILPAGIGARVMMTAFLVTVAAYGAVLWYYAAPTHQL